MCAGIGVHKGIKARMIFTPAAPGSGIRFIRTDITDREAIIAARGDAASDLALGTTLTNADGVSVAVVEHLLAACAGLGIDNLDIAIDGPEVPIMDGSANLYCQLLMGAGLKQQPVPRRRIRILDTLSVHDGPRRASLSPTADTYLTLRARIEFDDAVIGVQQIALCLKPGVFARDLAYARTFGFAADVEKLRKMGLARGGSLENAVVVDGTGVLNPEGLRGGDEFVRHKVLDAVGDLMLAGGPIAGKYEAVRPGHALNNALVRKLLATPEAWCWEVDRREPEVASGLGLSATGS